MRRSRFGAGCVVLGLLAQVAWAGGPRWVTGQPYFNVPGLPVVWYSNSVEYFTDPGDLSASVDHAAADALVAAAAGVWNVPVASLVLTQGGNLNEHVSGGNTYIGTTGVVFPADVLPGNYLSKQIAVIYDHDGSVTDLLLGAGASDPSGCLQAGVTESVDAISPAGLIQHAVLVLNGRCTGSAPEMQLQMQYQLMRAFGRVLGLAWSQTNDNVFTQTPAPTYQQAMHWPVMHPIDIVCGLYTYQCMPEPFTLRMDDISSLASLYYIPRGQAGPGKVDTLANANRVRGVLSFPTGQGMRGVNVLGRRLEQFWGMPEDWYSVSSVTGPMDRRFLPTPVQAGGTSIEASMGRAYPDLEGEFDLTRLEIFANETWQDVWVETEAVNPLYVGQYAVGSNTTNTITPSGSVARQMAEVQSPYSDSWVALPPMAAASTCATSQDGTERAPAAVASSGWWSGLLCAYGHVAWWTLPVKAGRSLTVEATAQDEQGFATATKAMPVIGVWHATDPLGSLPGVAAATEAFNGTSLGMTSLTVQSTQPESLRMMIADERGDGRPDFGYGARVLYADAVTPANVGSAGGVVTITGLGFRPGNAVTVNGVAAAVLSWTSTAMVATVPASGAAGTIVADVMVSDTSSGGTTVMTGVLTYAAPVPEVMTLVSAPSGTVYVGDVAAEVFAVRAMRSDGVTPVVGEAVVFSVAGGSVRFGACGAGSCTVMTDATGLATTTVSPMGPGGTVVSATSVAGGVAGSFMAVTRVRTAVVVQAVEYVAAGAAVTWQPQVMLADNSGSVAGVGVNWLVKEGAMGLASSVTAADGHGVAGVSAVIGAQATGTACAWVSVCAGFGVEAVGSGALQVKVVRGGGQMVGLGGVLGPVVLQVTDGVGHPVVGAVVEVHQTVEGGSVCSGRGRCPVAPMLGSSDVALTSDGSGLVTVVPLQRAGVAEVTNVAVSVGTQGFCSLSLLLGQ